MMLQVFRYKVFCLEKILITIIKMKEVIFAQLWAKEGGGGGLEGQTV